MSQARGLRLFPLALSSEGPRASPDLSAWCSEEPVVSLSCDQHGEPERALGLSFSLLAPAKPSSTDPLRLPAVSGLVWRRGFLAHSRAIKPQALEARALSHRPSSLRPSLLPRCYVPFVSFLNLPEQQA